MISPTPWKIDSANFEIHDADGKLIFEHGHGFVHVDDWQIVADILTAHQPDRERDWKGYSPISQEERLAPLLEALHAWRRAWSKTKTYLIDPEKDPSQNLATDLAMALEDFETAGAGDSQTGAHPSQGNPAPSSQIEDCAKVADDMCRKRHGSTEPCGDACCDLCAVAHFIRQSSKGGKE